MRKLFLPGVLVVALFVACENKSPVGPNGLGPGGLTVTQTTSTTTTTTTTTIAPTSSTSTSSTTTSVVGGLSRRYQAFPVAPNAPADMTLFFQLIETGSIVASLVERLPLLGAGPSAITENEYSVNGVYIMGNGTTGTVKGELGGSLNPLDTGGEFEGRLTATVGSCVAEREFEGDLLPRSLDWDGRHTLRDCPGSPLSMASFTLVSSDASAPLPSTTSTTTTSAPTTTTTSAATCAYTVSPTSGSAPAAGGTGQVSIGTTPSSCTWTAQSFAPSWLSVTPTSGTGSGVVQWTALANSSGSERTGTVVVTGVTFNLTFTVTQAAPADLTPVLTGRYCTVDNNGDIVVTAQATNIAAGPAVASVSRLITGDKFVVTANTPAIAGNSQTAVSFLVTDDNFCNFSEGVCTFTIDLDVNNAVFETSETNNSTGTGDCSFIGLTSRRLVRQPR